MNSRGIFETINTLIVETEVKLISSIILVFLIWLLRSLVLRVLFQRIKDERNRGLAQQIVGYASFVLGLILIGRLWLEGFQSLLIVLSVVLSALIIALKELFLNLASWSVIAWRQLFRIGDHIKIGDHYGEVVEMNMIYLTLVELNEKPSFTPVGHRIVKIPNSLVLTQPIVNDREGSHTLWYELLLSLHLNSDWKKAQEILNTLLQKHLRPIFPAEGWDPTDYIQVAVSVQTGRIVLHGRYLCNTDRQPEIEQALWQDLLSVLQYHEQIHLL